MKRLVEKKIQSHGLKETVQGIVENRNVIAVKVLDDIGQPISWAMTDRQIEQYKRIIEKESQCFQLT